METGPLVLSDEAGSVTIEPLPTGRLLVSATGSDGRAIDPASPIETAYPLDLVRQIFAQFGAMFTCDEIGRDTDGNDASLDVRYSVEAYCDDEFFSRPMRILDYGCGSGSSTMALARLFPHAELVGVDFVEEFLAIARSRAAHYGVERAEFRRVQASGTETVPETSRFDAAFLNAVYEHLLPSERPRVLASIWGAMKPGAILFLNQTPHRWFPVETHTTGLPLINYLPRSLAHPLIRRYCRRAVREYDWPGLLRAGVRGATPREILDHIRRLDPQATLLRPERVARSWPGIWYAAKERRLRKDARLGPWIRTLRIVVEQTGLPLTPYISIAVRKP